MSPARRFPVTGLVTAFLAATLVVSACATTGADATRDGITGLGPSDVTGGVVQHFRSVDTRVTRAAAFGPTAVAVTAGASHSARLDRTPAGTWKGGIGGGSENPSPELLNVELAFADGRITGPSVNVRYTPGPDGFRLDGLWFGENVSLEVTTRFAQVRSIRWVPDSAGNFVSPDRETVEFLGDARRLDAPTMPQMALMLLLFGWGVP